MDIGNLCELCEEFGDHDCMLCDFGNPCIGCTDYDLVNDYCKSNGACADSDYDTIKKKSLI